MDRLIRQTHQGHFLEPVSMVKTPVAPRPPPKDRPKNHLLRALPAADFQRLLPDLTTIATPTKHVFYRNGEPLTHVYFPNGGVASVTAVLGDGTMVETATIGVEGMVGIEAFLGKNAIAPGDAMMQVGDTNAEQLNIVVFRRELARQGAIFELVGRYAQSALALMMQ